MKRLKAVLKLLRTDLEVLESVIQTADLMLKIRNEGNYGKRRKTGA